jgi:hypothetical protein
MESMFTMYVFGHFVGDFFLQYKKMADNKNQTGWNATFWCTAHVVVYTLTLALFTGNYSALFLLCVAVPHWMADRFSLAYQWMKLTGGSALMPHTDPTKAAFGVAIYIAIDQTFHLGCLYALMWIMVQ